MPFPLVQILSLDEYPCIEGHEETSVFLLMNNTVRVLS
jgi:hypothetical protein